MDTFCSASLKLLKSNPLLDQIQQLYYSNKVLALGAGLFVGLALIILGLLPFESRQVLGINLWIKPLKFVTSIGIFLLTSLYILQPLGYSSVKLNVVSWVLLGTMLVEIVCILFQASRGQLSHFNISDSLGSALFSLMGFAITIAYLTYGLLLIDYFRLDTSLSPVMLWAIRIGIVIFLIGAISGFSMASSLKHTVGMADGGPGLPFTNWSTVAGDLRVSHFISIHAIQVLPVVAITLVRSGTSQTKGLYIILIFGVIYGLFCVLTLLQAMQGRPFIRI